MNFKTKSFKNVTSNKQKKFTIKVSYAFVTQDHRVGALTLGLPGTLLGTFI